MMVLHFSYSPHVPSNISQKNTNDRIEISAGSLCTERGGWCARTPSFFWKKKQVLFSERKLTLDGFTTEVGSTLNMWIYIYTYTYDIRCGFITFIQFVFFITCFSSKCWRFVGQKTLPIISSFGGSVSVIFTSSLDDWKTQSETNVWY